MYVASCLAFYFYFFITVKYVTADDVWKYNKDL